MADPTILLRQTDLRTRFFTYMMIFLGLMSTIILSLHWIVVFIGLLAWRPKILCNEEAEIEMTTYVVDNSPEFHHHHSHIAPSFAGIQETHDLCVSAGPLLVAPADISLDNTLRSTSGSHLR